jgi:hypothetical protein
MAGIGNTGMGKINFKMMESTSGLRSKVHSKPVIKSLKELIDTNNTRLNEIGKDALGDVEQFISEMSTFKDAIRYHSTGCKTTTSVEQDLGKYAKLSTLQNINKKLSSIDNELQKLQRTCLDMKEEANGSEVEAFTTKKGFTYESTGKKIDLNRLLNHPQENKGFFTKGDVIEALKSGDCYVIGNMVAFDINEIEHKEFTSLKSLGIKPEEYC